MSNALEQFDALMPTEIDVLKELVRVSGAREALEIGMARASSSVSILAALPPDGHLTSIDPADAGVHVVGPLDGRLQQLEQARHGSIIREEEAAWAVRSRAAVGAPFRLT